MKAMNEETTMIIAQNEDLGKTEGIPEETANQQATEAFEASEDPAQRRGGMPGSTEGGEQDAGQCRSSEHWYQRIGRSAGATIGAGACALALVAIVAGGSAFLGTQMASHGTEAERGHMAQSLENGDQRQFGSESHEGGSLPSGRDLGVMPDMGDSSDRALDMEKPDKGSGRNDRGSATDPADSNAKNLNGRNGGSADERESGAAPGAATDDATV